MAGSIDPYAYAFAVNCKPYRLSTREKQLSGSIVRLSRLESKRATGKNSYADWIDPAFDYAGEDGDDAYLCVGVKPPNSAAASKEKSKSKSVNECLKDDMYMQAALDPNDKTTRIVRVQKDTGRWYFVSRSADGSLVGYSMEKDEGFIFKDYRDDTLTSKAKRQAEWVKIQDQASLEITGNGTTKKAKKQETQSTIPLTVSKAKDILEIKKLIEDSTPESFQTIAELALNALSSLKEGDVGGEHLYISEFLYPDPDGASDLDDYQDADWRNLELELKAVFPNLFSGLIPLERTAIKDITTGIREADITLEYRQISTYFSTFDSHLRLETKLKKRKNARTDEERIEFLKEMAKDVLAVTERSLGASATQGKSLPLGPFKDILAQMAERVESTADGMEKQVQEIQASLGSTISPANAKDESLNDMWKRYSNAHDLESANDVKAAISRLCLASTAHLVVGPAATMLRDHANWARRVLKESDCEEPKKSLDATDGEEDDADDEDYEDH